MTPMWTPRIARPSTAIGWLFLTAACAAGPAVSRPHVRIFGCGTANRSGLEDIAVAVDEAVIQGDLAHWDQMLRATIAGMSPGGQGITPDRLLLIAQCDAEVTDGRLLLRFGPDETLPLTELAAQLRLLRGFPVVTILDCHLNSLDSLEKECVGTLRLPAEMVLGIHCTARGETYRFTAGLTTMLTAGKKFSELERPLDGRGIRWFCTAEDIDLTPLLSGPRARGGGT